MPYPWSSGNVLSASDLNAAFAGYTVNAQTAAGYTLVLTDRGKLVTVSNASAQNLTIPLNSSVAFATGTWIDVLNIGSGTWTVTATGGVTLTGTTAIPTNGRVRLTKTGTDTWYSSAFGGGAFTFITSGTATATAAANFNNCFTTAYENYRVIIENVTADANRTLNLRWRASAADNSTSNYSYQYGYDSSTTVAASRSTAQSNGVIGYASTTAGSFYVIDVSLPQVAAYTTAIVTGTYSQSAALDSIRYSNLFSATTQFDGFSILASAGTFTTPTNGIRVYGYSNS